MSTSVYLKNKILNHVLRNTTYTPPDPIYIALYLSNPGDYDTGTEMSGSGYARKEAPAFTVSGSLASIGSYTSFAPASGSWGWITHYGIKNSLTSGSLLFYGELRNQTIPGGTYTSASRYIRGGDSFAVHSGSLVICIAGAYSNYLAGELLDHILNNNAYASPGTDVYAALYTTLPDANDSGGTEVSGTGYTRKKISGSSWTAPTQGYTYNVEPLVFTTSAPDIWGTIEGICLRDAASGGNILFRGGILPPSNILSGDSFKFDAGNLTVVISLDSSVFE